MAIYNSRNFNLFLDSIKVGYTQNIYNSRNFNLFLDTDNSGKIAYDLQ